MLPLFSRALCPKLVKPVVDTTAVSAGTRCLYAPPLLLTSTSHCVAGGGTMAQFALCCQRRFASATRRGTPVKRKRASAARKGKRQLQSVGTRKPPHNPTRNYPKKRKAPTHLQPFIQAFAVATEGGKADTEAIRARPREDAPTAQLLHFSQDTSKVARNTRFTLKPMTRASARSAAEKVDYKLLDYVANNFVERDVLEMPWHQMDAITDEQLSSLRAHDLMFMFDAGANSVARLSAIGDAESALFAELRGKALHLRLVDLGGSAPDAGPTAFNGNSRNADATGNGTSRSGAALVREVMAALETILADYAITFLHPFHMEVGCDVSHYASAAPLVAAAERNVDQYVADVHCLLEQVPFAAKGSETYATKAELQPLSADAVALDVAHRIRREIFGTRSAQSSSAPAPRFARDIGKRFCVCIGVADRPVLAKMACDAEVVALRLLQRRERQRNAPQVADGRGVAAQPVRVRSFYEAIRTVKDAKSFVAPFRLHHVPTFSPAVVRILREVFHIEKVGDIYPMRERLFFSLSKDTFRHVYAAAFGCMRFAEEQSVPLVCPPNMDAVRDSLKALATNAIALLTPSRTALRAHSSASGLRRVGTYARGLNATDHTLAYGRLFTEEQFLEVAEKVADTLAKRLQRKGYETGGYRLALRRGLITTIARTVTLAEPTNNRDVLLASVRRTAKRLARFRQKKGTPETSGEAFHINMGLLKLRLSGMNPPRQIKQIQSLTDRYRAAYFELRASAVYRALLRESRAGRLTPPRRIPLGKGGTSTMPPSRDSAVQPAETVEQEEAEEGDDESDEEPEEKGAEAFDAPALGDEPGAQPEEAEEAEEDAHEDEEEADDATADEEEEEGSAPIRRTSVPDKSPRRATAHRIVV